MDEMGMGRGEDSEDAVVGEGIVTVAREGGGKAEEGKSSLGVSGEGFEDFRDFGRG